RWSAGVRFGDTATEQSEGESLDQLLSEEEPDPVLDFDDDDDEDEDLEDDDAGDEDVDGLLLDDGPDPRAGRLVAEDEGAHPDAEADLVARDVGRHGGARRAGGGAIGARGMSGSTAARRARRRRRCTSSRTTTPTSAQVTEPVIRSTYRA